MCLPALACSHPALLSSQAGCGQPHARSILPVSISQVLVNHSHCRRRCQQTAEVTQGQRLIPAGTSLDTRGFDRACILDMGFRTLATHAQHSRIPAPFSIWTSDRHHQRGCTTELKPAATAAQAMSPSYVMKAAGTQAIDFHSFRRIKPFICCQTLINLISAAQPIINAQFVFGHYNGHTAGWPSS